jgi:hypothetical protein
MLLRRYKTHITAILLGFLAGTNARVVAQVRQQALYQTNDDVIVLPSVSENLDYVAVEVPLVTAFDLAEHADAGEQLKQRRSLIGRKRASVRVPKYGVQKIMLAKTEGGKTENLLESSQARDHPQPSEIRSVGINARPSEWR